MKHFTLVLFSISISCVLFGQTLDPATDIERCPTPNYPNGAGQSHTLTFPDSAKYYSIGTTTNCIISFYNNNVSGEPFKATCTIQFKDQSAAEHKFEIKKGTTVVKTFVFTKIKSIADRTIDDIIPPLNAPACNTSLLYVQFAQMNYRKTGSSSSADDYGSPIPFYEYQLPQGWTITSGYVGSSSTPGLIVGTNNVTIQPNFLGGGDIKVRAVNAQCGDFFNKSQWRTIPVTRATPVLKINGSTSLTLYCGDVSAKTFAIENASQFTCVTSYEWVTANKGWYDVNNNLITSNIITATPSITIYPSCNSSNPAKDIEVLMKAGSEVLSSKILVTFSTTAPSLTITGPAEFCTTASYSVPVSPACGASVTWSLEYLDNYPNAATLSCTNCQTTTLTKYNGGTALLRATISFPNCNSTGVYEKYIGVGTPIFKGWYNSPTNSQEPLNPWTRANMNATNLACYGTYITTSTDITANANVVWQAAGIPSGMGWSQIGNNLQFYFADIDQEAFFSVSITNSCGTKSIRYRFTSVGDNCSGGILLRVLLSPNPATNTINVTLTDKTDLNKQKEIIEIRLIDKMGNVKQKWNYGKGSGNQTRQINVSSFPADIYTVMIFDGVNWTSEKFIKQ